MKKLLTFIEQQIYHFIFVISILCVFLFIQNWRLSSKVESLIIQQSKLESVLTNSSDKYIITKSLILQDTLVSNINKLNLNYNTLKQDFDLNAKSTKQFQMELNFNINKISTKLNELPKSSK